ncbi:MAG: MnhB domain-containing protein [Terriglobales bacterium]
MSLRVRLPFFIISGLGFLAFYIWGLRGLPAFGHYRGPYGDFINAITVFERHVTDTVTAVNFDFRGLDTLGEEFILFISVVGVTLLLRKEEHSEIQGSERDQSHGRMPTKSEPRAAGRADDEQASDQRDQATERNAPSPSDATRVLTLGLVGPLVLFGIYIVTHGQLTPGGGFQGGVILATAPLLVYLAGSLPTFKHIVSHTLVEITDAMGAGGYVLIGLAAPFLGANFLANIVPLGTTGNVNSGGTIPLINLAVGLEVASAFVLLLYAFLEETLERMEERED